ncbi:predicted protein [Naegleria gruberi]|uniref:Predicted protein n=1 Tax=Naegleria gruberi TaxID=5762 RepID=D2W3T8_NAEGR|nr:uncharacterized protein NAEGRDRAFT_76063 [Naegleria gruberi]EFC36251.1 predicted protein [Naegleria gruberi]|eukprot:XP_002668995.1 predicted protein [Naegleria gruberi strain NEG-M]
MGSYFSRRVNTQPTTNNQNNSMSASSSTTSDSNMQQHSNIEEETKHAENQIKDGILDPQEHEHAKSLTSVKLKFSNKLESNFNNQESKINSICKAEGMNLSIELKNETSFQFRTPNNFNSENYPIMYDVKESGRICVYKFYPNELFELKETERHMLIIPVIVKIDQKKSNGNLILKLNERKFAVAYITNDSCGQVYESFRNNYKTENIQFLNVFFKNKQPCLSSLSTFISFDLSIGDEKDFNIELCRSIQGNALQFALVDESFDLTTPNYYNSQMNELFPIFYQYTNVGPLIFKFEEPYVYVEFNEGRMVIPIMVERFDQQVHVDFVLDLIDANDGNVCIETNMECTQSVNQVCFQHFQNTKRKQETASVIEEDSLFHENVKFIQSTSRVLVFFEDCTTGGNNSQQSK